LIEDDVLRGDSRIPPELLDTITTGDARLLSAALPDESVDLVFCDPPYAREYLPLYGWLGQEAARVLKPGGFLLAYVGGAWKGEVIPRLNASLTFFWDYVTIDAGRATFVWDRRTVAKSKSILAYVKGKAFPRTAVLGVWEGGGGDKRFHAWGQDEQSARYYIDCFSAPGDAVVDFFAGGGTTPAVCLQLNRHYVAFEIDPDTAERARERVQNTQPPLPGLEVEQAHMELTA
jgi:hypothetical protein